MKRENQCRSYI